MDFEIGEEDVLAAINSTGISIELIEKYYPRIFEPLGKPSQLNLTPREFFYWTDKGVIDIPKQEEGQSPWSRLNLIEMLWIRIVTELRGFNMPFASLIAFKVEMFGSYLSMMKENQEITQNAINTLNLSPIEKKINEVLLNIENIEQHELLKEFKFLFAPITGIIMQILFYKKNIDLIIYKNKKEFCFTVEGFKHQELVQDEIDNAKKHTHLILNLRSIVAEYLLEPNLEHLNEEFGFITEDEKELIKVIRNKLVKEIHIKKDDNETITYTTTSKTEIKDEQVKMIKRLLRMNEFDEVRVVLRNEKHLYIENKKKIKIRPIKKAQK